MIELTDCITVKSAESKAGRRYALEVSTKEVTYLMYADSEKEKDDWIGTFCVLLCRCGCRTSSKTSYFRSRSCSTSQEYEEAQDCSETACFDDAWATRRCSVRVKMNFPVSPTHSDPLLFSFASLSSGNVGRAIVKFSSSYDEAADQEGSDDDE